MNWTALSNAFKDANGDFNLAEGIAAPAALAGVTGALWDCFGRGHALDLQAFGLGIGAIVAAVGAAQRLRGDVEHDRERKSE